jgi:hypothetical protein
MRVKALGDEEGQQEEWEEGVSEYRGWQEQHEEARVYTGKY